MNFEFSGLKLKVTAVLILVLCIILLFYLTLSNTLLISNMCGLCHMMKPEYYTWQASSHAKFNCTTCHGEPGKKDILTSSFSGAKHFFNAVTGRYVAPIIKLDAMSDGSCEQCHNMANRIITTPERIVVPHDKHKQEGINCYKCHSGITHGNIAKRRVTYATDYEKWDTVLASSMMDDTKFTRPNMDTCMNCHKVRKATLKCEDCHDIRPLDHRDKEFINKSHGKMAFEDLRYCDSCHYYTISEEYNRLKEQASYIEYLDKANSTKQRTDVAHYAKYNTYCRACHKKRPTGHDEDFNNNHGHLAESDKEGCMVCHDNQLREDSVTRIVCSSCHPSIHETSVQWEWGGYHPTPLGPNPKLTDECYGCHSRSGCARCHG